MTSTLLRRVRLVPVAGVAAPDGPVDLRLRDGRVAEVERGLRPQSGERVVDADGRWATPGLWDHHVHLTAWSRVRSSVDLAGTNGPDDVLDRLVRHLAALPAGSGTATRLLTGYGYRSATWSDAATVAALDAVTGAVPTILTSGDAHNGWLNTAALRRLGLPEVDGPFEERDWFDLHPRVSALWDDLEAELGANVLQDAIDDACARGVVGVVDLEMPASWRQWTTRGGSSRLRVRASVYPSGLDEALEAELRTGDRLCEDTDLVTMGPLKIITDGSLNTATAWCCEPYGDPSGPGRSMGAASYPYDEILGLVSRAHRGGLEVALHAIGDRALDVALQAFEATGATGTVEHAQLVRLEDLPRMARARVRASVQPAHLLDDRDVTHRLWADRADRCFPLRSMLDAGARLAFGSDAPVAPLDPWLAMAAAVHRSADERPPWNPAESLTAADALAASTDGAATLGAGSSADLILLNDHPLRPKVGGQGADPEQTAAAAATLRNMRVAATFVAGEPTHLAL